MTTVNIEKENNIQRFYGGGQSLASSLSGITLNRSNKRVLDIGIPFSEHLSDDQTDGTVTQTAGGYTLLTDGGANNETSVVSSFNSSVDNFEWRATFTCDLNNSLAGASNYNAYGLGITDSLGNKLEIKLWKNDGSTNFEIITDNGDPVSGSFDTAALQPGTVTFLIRRVSGIITAWYNVDAGGFIQLTQTDTVIGTITAFRIFSKSVSDAANPPGLVTVTNIFLECDGNATECNLYSPVDLKSGGPYHYILNSGPGSLDIKDGPTTRATLNSREVAICLILKTATGNEWRVIKEKILGRVLAVGYRLTTFPAILEEGQTASIIACAVDTKGSSSSIYDEQSTTLTVKPMADDEDLKICWGDAYETFDTVTFDDDFSTAIKNPLKYYESTLFGAASSAYDLVTFENGFMKMVDDQPTTGRAQIGVYGPQFLSGDFTIKYRVRALVYTGTNAVTFSRLVLVFNQANTTYFYCPWIELDNSSSDKVVGEYAILGAPNNISGSFIRDTKWHEVEISRVGNAITTKFDSEVIQTITDAAFGGDILLAAIDSDNTSTEEYESNVDRLQILQGTSTLSASLPEIKRWSYPVDNTVNIDTTANLLNVKDGGTITNKMPNTSNGTLLEAILDNVTGLDTNGDLASLSFSNILDDYQIGVKRIVGVDSVYVNKNAGDVYTDPITTDKKFKVDLRNETSQSDNFDGTDNNSNEVNGTEFASKYTAPVHDTTLLYIRANKYITSTYNSTVAQASTSLSHTFAYNGRFNIESKFDIFNWPSQHASGQSAGIEIEIGGQTFIIAKHLGDGASSNTEGFYISANAVIVYDEQNLDLKDITFTFRRINATTLKAYINGIQFGGDITVAGDLTSVTPFRMHNGNTDHDERLIVEYDYSFVKISFNNIEYLDAYVSDLKFYINDIEVHSEDDQLVLINDIKKESSGLDAQWQILTAENPVGTEFCSDISGGVATGDFVDTVLTADIDAECATYPATSIDFPYIQLNANATLQSVIDNLSVRTQIETVPIRVWRELWRGTIINTAGTGYYRWEYDKNDSIGVVQINNEKGSFTSNNSSNDQLTNQIKDLDDDFIIVSDISSEEFQQVFDFAANNDLSVLIEGHLKDIASDIYLGKYRKNISSEDWNIAGLSETGLTNPHFLDEFFFDDSAEYSIVKHNNKVYGLVNGSVIAQFTIITTQVLGRRSGLSGPASIQFENIDASDLIAFYGATVPYTDNQLTNLVVWDVPGGISPQGLFNIFLDTLNKYSGSTATLSAEDKDGNLIRLNGLQSLSVTVGDNSEFKGWVDGNLITDSSEVAYIRSKGTVSKNAYNEWDITVTAKDYATLFWKIVTNVKRIPPNVDFTLTVDLSNIALVENDQEAILYISPERAFGKAGTEFSSIGLSYSSGTLTIKSNDSTAGSTLGPAPGSTPSLRIQKIGSNYTLDYDIGGGFVTLDTVTTLDEKQLYASFIVTNTGSSNDASVLASNLNLTFDNYMSGVGVNENIRFDFSMSNVLSYEKLENTITDAPNYIFLKFEITGQNIQRNICNILMIEPSCLYLWAETGRGAYTDTSKSLPIPEDSIEELDNLQISVGLPYGTIPRYRKDLVVEKLSQATGSQQPTLKEYIYNGNDHLLFDRTNDESLQNLGSEENRFLHDGNEWYIAFVFESTVSEATQNILTNTQGNLADIGLKIFVDTVNKTVKVRINNGTSEFAHDTVDDAFDETIANLVEVYMYGNKNTIKINGVEISTKDLDITPSTAAALHNLTLAGQGDSGSGDGFSGYLPIDIIANKQMSGIEADQLRLYVWQKTGVLIKYKTTPSNTHNKEAINVIQRFPLILVGSNVTWTAFDAQGVQLKINELASVTYPIPFQEYSDNFNSVFNPLFREYGDDWSDGLSSSIWTQDSGSIVTVDVWTKAPDDTGGDPEVDVWTKLPDD